MLDANSISIDNIVSIFSGAEAQERIAFIEECPMTNMKEQALIAAKMSLPEMQLQSLDFLALGCTTTGPYDLGAKIGAACYRLARDRYEKELGQSMT